MKYQVLFSLKNMIFQVLFSLKNNEKNIQDCHHYVCVCIPILLTTFPEWLSGTEPLPHTPGAVHPSSFCFVVFCVHMHSFAALIRPSPSLTFSDTAITNPQL